MNHDLKNIIVKHYAGSISYGTNLPTSDVDIRGIFCADREFITLPFYSVDELNLPDEEDGKVYELAKFIELYTKGNPNILETLWVDQADIIEADKSYWTLLKHRENLLSSKVAHTFSGYAYAQLKRIKGHDKWLNNPKPVEAPKQKDFIKMIQNFTEKKIFNKDFKIEDFKDKNLVHYGNNIYGIIEPTGVSGEAKVLTSNGDFNVSAKQNENVEITRKKPLVLIKFVEAEYKRAKEDHKNYWSWKANRNVKRHDTENKFGYDTKHAMHLVRLMRMSEEILTGKGVIVKRPDAKELLEIRNGSWTYDELIKYAEEMDDYIKNDLYLKTHLPKKPDIKLAGEVLMELQDYYWSK